MFVDTHCHLDHPALAGRLSDVLASARRAGVEKFVVPGTVPEGWKSVAALAAGETGVYAAYGLHPLFASRFGEDLLQELTERASNAVAIGEIGLDYAVEGVSRDEQRTALRSQSRLAVRLGLPVLLHCRKAFQDLLHIVREERLRKVGGILHGFSGSFETACEFMKEGFLISFGGSITYANAVRPPAVAARMPLDRLVLETDAPDMTPEPHRSKVNEPAFLLETARKVADIKGIPLAELARATTDNALRLLHIEEE